MSIDSIRTVKWMLIALFVVGFCSCSKNPPVGEFSGEIKDWVHEVFTGKYVTSTSESPIDLILRNTPNGMLAEMTFRHPKIKTVKRMGTWEVGDGERVIRFNDGKIPSEYFLIKRGVRFAFQTKKGLSNEDGSPILLMRNEGLSRKAAYPLKIEMREDGKAIVVGGAAKAKLFGEWRPAGTGYVVVTQLPLERKEDSVDEALETYKYFLEWAGKDSNDLILKKIVLMKPFLKKDGSKRQSWMSSLIFDDDPRLKFKNK